jgi:hypothetical protein
MVLPEPIDSSSGCAWTSSNLRSVTIAKVTGRPSVSSAHGSVDRGLEYGSVHRGLK